MLIGMISLILSVIYAVRSLRIPAPESQNQDIILAPDQAEEYSKIQGYE